jgi:hypothetical protein
MYAHISLLVKLRILIRISPGISLIISQSLYSNVYHMLGMYPQLRFWVVYVSPGCVPYPSNCHALLGALLTPSRCFLNLFGVSLWILIKYLQYLYAPKSTFT